MIFTAIMAGIIGAFFGMVIACLIRTVGDAEADAWRAFVEQQRANDGDRPSVLRGLYHDDQGHTWQLECNADDVPLVLRGYKLLDTADGNGGDGNLVVLERGELAEVERLSALLERCRSYMRHFPLCGYVRNGVECNCGMDGLLAEMDGWHMAAKAGAGHD